MREVDIDKFIKQAQGVFASYPIVCAYLYGSFAEGTPRDWSDLDIGLMVEDSIMTDSYLDLEMEITAKLEKEFSGIECDVRIFNAAPLNFKIQIVQEGKLIYSKDEVRRVDFETDTRDKYFDFLPFRIEFRDNLFDNIKKGGLLWSTPKK